nr:MAG TPA: hypothetical protein [Bacteriophage sp.]
MENRNFLDMVVLKIHGKDMRKNLLNSRTC